MDILTNARLKIVVQFAKVNIQPMLQDNVGLAKTLLNLAQAVPQLRIAQSAKVIEKLYTKLIQY